MKKLCRVLALVLVFASAFQVVPVSANANVSKEEKINTLKERGIVKGYLDGTLGLDKNIKRSEIASLLVNLSGNADKAKNAGSDVFKDVKNSHWAYGIIDIASKLENQSGDKLINGYPDGTFKPDNEITNAEIIKILVSLKKTDLTEKDIAEAIWPNSWVVWGSDANIVGKSAGVTNINVREAAKRGDVFAMLYNTIYDENKNPISNQFKLGGSSNSIVENKPVVDKVVEKKVVEQKVAQKTDNKAETKQDLVNAVAGFNNGSTFNYSAFENKFIELVNDDRARLGRNPLRLGGDLDSGTLQRSRELAEYGDIRVNGKGHVRLNGDEFYTAMDYLGYGNDAQYIFGENLMLFTENIYGNRAKLQNFKYLSMTPEQLAKEFYEGWWNSPGHRDNMMREGYGSLSLKIYADLKEIGENNYELKIVGTTIFKISENSDTFRRLNGNNFDDSRFGSFY